MLPDLKANKYLLVCLYFTILIFVLYFFEIFLVFNRDSYFSDSENYYLASSVFPPNNYDSFVYVYLLSFFRSVLSYKLTLILFISIYLSLTLFWFRSLKLKNINLLFLFHPFIIFIFARGLKEIAIIIFFLVFFRFYNHNKVFSILNFSLVICFSLLLDGLKPLGAILVPISLLLTYFLSNFLKTRSLLYYGGLLLLIAPLLRNTLIDLIPTLKNHVNVLWNSGYAVEYTRNFVKPILAFVFGPGPFKSFQSFFYPVYEFGTIMTSLTLLVGSIISIILVIKLISKINSIQNCKWNNFIIIFTIIHVISYILIQDGSVDTRQRGLMFFYLGLIRWK